jgi:hypothetical protein
MPKHARENQPKASHIKEAVRTIESLKDDRASEHGRYMARCAKINASIAGAKDQAKDRGIPRKELNALLKKRDLLRKVAAVRADLEADERGTLDMLESQLGDFGKTALGRAAIEADKLAAADSAANGGDRRTAQQHALEELTKHDAPQA